MGGLRPSLICKGLWRSNCLFGLRSHLADKQKEETQTFTRLKITALICRVLPGRFQSHQAPTAALMRYSGQMTYPKSPIFGCITMPVLLQKLGPFLNAPVSDHVLGRGLWRTRKMLLSYKAVNGLHPLATSLQQADHLLSHHCPEQRNSTSKLGCFFLKGAFKKCQCSGPTQINGIEISGGRVPSVFYKLLVMSSRGLSQSQTW